MALVYLTEFQRKDGSKRIDIRVFSGTDRIIEAMPGPDEEVVARSKSRTETPPLPGQKKRKTKPFSSYELQREAFDVYQSVQKGEIEDITHKL